MEVTLALTANLKQYDHQILHIKVKYKHYLAVAIWGIVCTLN